MLVLVSEDNNTRSVDPVCFGTIDFESQGDEDGHSKRCEDENKTEQLLRNIQQ